MRLLLRVSSPFIKVASLLLQLFKDTEPVFIAKEFGFKFNLDKTPSAVAPRRPLGTHALYSDEKSTKLTRVNFTVGCANITQRVNLSFVRLATQIVDMLDLLSHACRTKASGDDVDAPRPLVGGTQFPGTRHAAARRKVSPGSVKCWRIMDQVLDLYSSLPREAKNKGFMRKKLSLAGKDS